MLRKGEKNMKIKKMEINKTKILGQKKKGKNYKRWKERIEKLKDKKIKCCVVALTPLVCDIMHAVKLDFFG